MKFKDHHIFRIGSNTKQFAAVAALKLAQEGKISVDDEIQEYVPGFPKCDAPVTIKHLLSHTSGVKNHTDIQKWNPPDQGLTARLTVQAYLSSE